MIEMFTQRTRIEKRILVATVYHMTCPCGFNDHTAKVIEGLADSDRIVGNERAWNGKTHFRCHRQLKRLELGLPHRRRVTHPAPRQTHETAQERSSSLLKAKIIDSGVHVSGLRGRPYTPVPNAGGCGDFAAVEFQGLPGATVLRPVRNGARERIVFRVYAIMRNAASGESPNDIVRSDIRDGTDNQREALTRHPSFPLALALGGYVRTPPGACQERPPSHHSQELERFAVAHHSA